jgi:hypothetical protein
MAAPLNGLEGTLRLVQTSAQLNALLAATRPADPVALVWAPALLSRGALRAVQARLVAPALRRSFCHVYVCLVTTLILLDVASPRLRFPWLVCSSRTQTRRLIYLPTV